MNEDEHLDKLIEKEFGKFNYHKIMKEIFNSVKLKDENPDLWRRVNNIIAASLDEEALKFIKFLI